MIRLLERPQAVRPQKDLAVTTAPTPPETKLKFSTDGMIAALAIIRGSVALDEVRDSATYSNGDIERDITLELGPRFIEAALRRPVRKARMPVLISTPRKGKLRSVTNVRDGDGKEVRVLSHEEHELVAQMLLTVLLFRAHQPWLDADPVAAYATLFPARALLADLVAQPENIAKSKLNRVFTPAGTVKNAPPHLTDPELVVDLYKTATLLTARYLLLVDFKFRAGERNCVSFSQRSAYHEKLERLRDQAKSYLGGRPSYLRIQSPWARGTNSFHITCQVPPGHYALRRFATFRPEQDISRKAVHKLDALPSRNNARRSDTVTCEASPSIATPHLLIANGFNPSAEHPTPIDAVFLTQERPLGSAGATWLTSALTTTMAGILTVLGFKIPLAQVTSPALILALVAAIGTFSSTAFGTGDEGVSVLSKFLVFANAVVAVTFCWVWVVLQSRSSTTKAANLHSANGWLSLILLGILAVIWGIATVRVWNAVSNFQKVVASDN